MRQTSEGGEKERGNVRRGAAKQKHSCCPPLRLEHHDIQAGRDWRSRDERPTTPLRFRPSILFARHTPKTATGLRNQKIKTSKNRNRLLLLSLYTTWWRGLRLSTLDIELREQGIVDAIELCLSVLWSLYLVCMACCKVRISFEVHEPQRAV